MCQFGVIVHEGEYTMKPKDILTKEFLYDQYVVNNKSIHQIAKETGIQSPNSITQYLAKFHLRREPIRQATQTLTEDFLQEQYIDNGLSLREISKLLGIKNRSVVKNALQKFNIPIRKHTKSQSYISAQLSRRKYEEIAGSYWYTVIYAAHKRELVFDITPEYAWEIYLKQNRKCALSGMEIYFNECMNDKTTQTASLDRKDSKQGYIVGNIQWVHKKINRMKSNLNEVEFIQLCKMIAGNK